MKLEESYAIIRAIVRELAHAPDGRSTGQLAKQFGVDPKTIRKYIEILESNHEPIYRDGERWYLESEQVPAPKLSVEERILLTLALEDLSLNQRQLFGSVATLMDKMDHFLLGVSRRPHPDDLVERPADRFLKQIASALQERRELIVHYLPLRKSRTSRWRIRPARFVTNRFSDGLYVLCEGAHDERSFIKLSLKLDRFMDVEVTDRNYDIAQLAQMRAYEGLSWGVFYSEEEPQTVLLAFEMRHYDRLLETIWHPTQQIRRNNDGMVLFRVEVTQPQEMIPWIRSWGSGVKVLQPESLVRRMRRTIQRQMQRYGIQANSTDDGSRLDRLWAKYDRSTDEMHLLRYHALDVAAVAYQMWEFVLSPQQHNWITAILGISSDEARSLLAFLAGVHDVGKATPDFQRKVSALWSLLPEDLRTDQQYKEIPHGVYSAEILQRWFIDQGLDKRTGRQLAQSIGGHHGQWIDISHLKKAKGANVQEPWLALQTELITDLADILEVVVRVPEDRQPFNAFLMFVSGFISVCDWIGSSEQYFPYDAEPVDSAIYFGHALRVAEEALHDLRWARASQENAPSAFTDLFPFEPNTFQQAGLQQLSGESIPRLVLIEYATGGGKTELALSLADQWVRQADLAGLYVAMPTQATSNQMFGRVVNYLQRAYRGQLVNLQLTHGHAAYQPQFQELLAKSGYEDDDTDIVADAWFSNRKRALLAPYAVGTIDQPMLGVLQARHHFVRVFALSHKVFIMDEVHAYDTYMNAIIENMLAWLVALQSPIIMLSATLPRGDREKLVKQVGGDPQHLEGVPYPRMTVVDADGTVRVHALPAPPRRVLAVERIRRDLETLVSAVHFVYQQGGCICILCNTVDEAIAVAEALRAHDEVHQDDVWLFHARFPQAWRGDIEADVLEAFGKEGNRPPRKILVATQVVEQSLDLDFDIMFTSYAPIDLLVQRAGRVHRHDRERPMHLVEPTLVLRDPDFDADDVPDFGVDEAIYARYILLKTWLILQDRPAITTPDDLDDLIDTVYDSSEEQHAVYDESVRTVLDEARDGMLGEDNNADFRGRQKLIEGPDAERLISRQSLDLDDSEHHVQTRDMHPGVDIICVGDGTDLPALPDRKPTHEETANLLQHKITVRKRRYKEAIESLSRHKHWSGIAALRDARPIHFKNGQAIIEGFPMILQLTPDLGLVFIDLTEENPS